MSSFVPQVFRLGRRSANKSSSSDPAVCPPSIIKKRDSDFNIDLAVEMPSSSTDRSESHKDLGSNPLVFNRQKTFEEVLRVSPPPLAVTADAVPDAKADDPPSPSHNLGEDASSDASPPPIPRSPAPRTASR